MDKKELIAFFSEFWKVNPSEVRDDLKLDSQSLPNNTSIRFYQFLAGIESRFGVSVKSVEKIRNFKDLYSNISQK